MSIVLITGSGGLIGSEASRFFSKEGFDVVGIDDDHRAKFFGPDASVGKSIAALASVPRYQHWDIDIRNQQQVSYIFDRYGKNIDAIIHCASQPSHDWAASNPMEDFGVNALGTLTMLEATRKWAPDAPFVFMSSSKVYGDRPNTNIPYIEKKTRWEIGRVGDLARDYASFDGFNESMPVDQCLHSLFGVSKLSADLLVQEYGRYFGMKTVCFRPGCLTGTNHAGVEQHGFLSYLVKCAVAGKPYKIIGWGGKQVRDNIHSHDVVSAMWHFIQRPRSGAVYNLGGGRHSNCSILEAIADCERLTGRKMVTEYVDTPRIGDHVFYIGSPEKWLSHYPDWTWTYDHERLIAEMVQAEQCASAS